MFIRGLLDPYRDKEAVLAARCQHIHTTGENAFQFASS